jgi:hypothetical protein
MATATESNEQAPVDNKPKTGTGTGSGPGLERSQPGGDHSIASLTNAHHEVTAQLAATVNLTTQSQFEAGFRARFQSDVRPDGSFDPKVVDSTPLYRLNDSQVGNLSLSPGAVNDRGGVLNDSGQLNAPPTGRDAAGRVGPDIPKEKIASSTDGGDHHAGDQVGSLSDEQAAFQQNLNKIQDANARKQAQDSYNEIQENVKNGKMTPEQEAAFLHQVNRMFSEEDRITAQGLTTHDRDLTVASMMYDTANPERENQGQHNTCNGTTIGKVETMDDPAKNAQRVVDMYVNANGDHTVTMPDGFKVQYDVNSLRSTPESEYALTPEGKGQGARDQFTQAMNHLYINDMTQRQGLFYSQERSGQYGPSDTGERLRVGGFDGQAVGANGRPDGIPPESSPMINGDMIAQEMQRLEGRGGLIASNSHFGITDSGSTNVTNTDQLAAAWAANRGKPIIAAVDTRAGMFHDDGQISAQGGGHVVVIDGQRQVGTDANGKPIYEYHIANSWGDQNNGWASQNDVVAALDPSRKRGDGRGLQRDAGGASATGATPPDRTTGSTGAGDVPQPGTPGGGGRTSPTSSGGADGWATYDTGHTGVQRSDNGGLVPNHQNMTPDEAQSWYKRYQDELQKKELDELERTRIKRLMEQAAAAAGSDKGGG